MSEKMAEISRWALTRIAEMAGKADRSETRCVELEAALRETLQCLEEHIEREAERVGMTVEEICPYPMTIKTARKLVPDA